MIQVENKVAYDIQEMSEFLNLSEKTIRKYCATGKIQAKKIGKKWHATKEALQRFLEVETEETNTKD